MTSQQKKVLHTLLLLGGVYFAVFIIPNLSGAKDANMLAVFEVDEFAQYPHVIRMLTPGETPYQTLRNFFIYLHYFYGYPFYLFSALFILPIKLIYSQDWTTMTPVLLMVLRQMINVFPMILSCLLLVNIQTQFKSLWRSVGLFVLLLSVPAVVINNIWWHPDSLVFFFIVLTIYFLNRDDLKFGKNYFLAAASCGLAIGTKHLGLFFGLVIPLYLIWGVIRRKISIPHSVLFAFLFILVMVFAVIISNPLLLLPIERGEIISIFKLQIEQTGTGILIANPEPLFRLGELPEDISIHYGEGYFLILALLSLIIGLLRPSRRRLNALILAWMVPMTAIVAYSSTRRTHYLLPVMLPLFSCLVNYFPAQRLISKVTAKLPLLKSYWKSRIVLSWIAGALIVAQFVLFIRTDVDIIFQQLNRENSSGSIAFYNEIEKNVISKLPDQNIVVYRDWRIYFPPRDKRRVEMNWDLTTYDCINDLNPDLILLERENVLLFSDSELVAQAVEPGDMWLVYDFYSDVSLNQVPGYQSVFQNEFGYVLLRDSLYQEYFTD